MSFRLKCGSSIVLITYQTRKHMRTVVLSLFVLFFSSSLVAEGPSRTFSMIKPRAVQEQHIGAIIDQIEHAGLKVVAVKMVQINSDTAKTFYKEHEGKPFFNDLIAKMTSGPVVAMVIEGKDPVAALRALVGN